MDNLRFNATAVESELQKNGVFASVTSGVSMRPLFRTNRDMVILKKPERDLRKYDVVLYRVKSGKYVLHRIIRIDGNTLVIRGDNTYSLEYVDKSEVLAVLTEFNRKGKRISVENKGYLFYAKVWNFIYPARFVLKKALSLAKRVCKKLSKRK